MLYVNKVYGSAKGKVRVNIEWKEKDKQKAVSSPSGERTNRAHPLPPGERMCPVKLKN
jgi:hypothetical protein